MRRTLALLCLLSLAGVPAADAARKKGKPTPARATKVAKKQTGSGHVPARFLQRGPHRLTGTLPAAAPGTAPSEPGPQTPALPSLLDPAAGPLPTAVGVTAREFSLVLSRTRVGVGAITFSFANRGEDPHDLAVVALDGQGAGGTLPEVASLGVLTQAIGLAAGRYELRCTLPGHAAAGMRAALTSG